MPLDPDHEERAIYLVDGEIEIANDRHEEQYGGAAAPSFVVLFPDVYALIEAMQRRDGRTAARIIKAHIAQTEKRVLPALKRNAVIVEGRDA